MEEYNREEGTTSVELDVEIVGDIGKLAEALSKVQGEMKSIGKSEKGYGYNYANLASTIEVSSAITSKHGLAVSQLIGNSSNNPKVTTLLLHSSGAYIKAVACIDKVDMKGCNSAQEFGSGSSYLRRYTLQAILNMASSDNDASSEGTPKQDKSFKKKTMTPKTEQKSETKAKTSFRNPKKESGSEF